MQIIEITDPNEPEVTPEVVVGIDFGTTNSLIAYSKGHNLKVVGRGAVGGGLVPSVIFYDEATDSFEIGKNRGQAGAISSIKRLLAKSCADIQLSESLREILFELPLIDSLSSGGLPIPKLEFKHREYSFPELASEIFRFLKERAEEELKVPVRKAVVSVPAYFDDAARGAVLLAAKIAGLEVPRLIAEPTAAAYAYGFHHQAQGAYMVYDLGGGTFDVSILNMQSGVFQVVATGGDNLLGGDDLDNILARHIASQLSVNLTRAVLLEAKTAKELLSVEQSATLIVEGKKIELTRQILEELVLPIINRTVKIARETLFDSGISLDGIILVGGATRMPIIKAKLSEAFGIKVFSDIDPDTAVVMGAALQAENLSSGGRGALLLDVLPLSVGMELYGGITEKIIMRNTPLPFSVTKVFTTHADNQGGMWFHIVQGERELAKDCRSLARFELKNIPPMKAGKAKVEVTFSIDADGILSITAREVVSGLAKNIEISPSYGLREPEINDILENGFAYAEQDYITALLIQTRIDAAGLMSGVSRALEETPDLLTLKEKKEIRAAISSLQKIINSDNRDHILMKMQQLNKLASGFIEKHLNAGVQLALGGKRIQDI